MFSAGNGLYSNVDLVLYSTETEDETIIHDDNSANGGSMCWSPEGKRIYFHSLQLFGHPFRIKCLDLEKEEVYTILEAENDDFGYFHPEVF